jgi:hypothetical protein
MAKRRGNQEGSIYKRKGGLWCVQVSLDNHRADPVLQDPQRSPGVAHENPGANPNWTKYREWTDQPGRFPGEVARFN